MQRADGVGRPDRGELRLRANQEMPEGGPVVRLREDQREGNRIALWLDADRQHADALRIRAQVEHDAVQLFGDQRTHIRAVGIQKGEHDRLAPELRERHWLAELIGQVEVECGNAPRSVPCDPLASVGAGL